MLPQQRCGLQGSAPQSTSGFHSITPKWNHCIPITAILVGAQKGCGTPTGQPIPCQRRAGAGVTRHLLAPTLSQPGFQAGVFKCLLCCDSNDERPENGTNKDELYFRIKKPMKAADAVIGINCINSDQMGSEKSEWSCSVFHASSENFWVHEFSQNQVG